MNGERCDPLLNQQRVRLVGVALIMISVFPIVQGMINSFTLQSSPVEPQLSHSAALAMSPLFIAMSSVGIGLVVVSLFLRKTG